MNSSKAQINNQKKYKIKNSNKIKMDLSYKNKKKSIKLTCNNN